MTRAGRDRREDNRVGFSAYQRVQAASHQRQLLLEYNEIQQRLIDNQSLLNTLEKAGDPCSLESLLSELKRRVEQDKEALREWIAVQKSTYVGGNSNNLPLATKLLQFSRGCDLVLQLMIQDDPQVYRRRNVPGKFISRTFLSSFAAPLVPRYIERDT